MEHLSILTWIKIIIKVLSPVYEFKILQYLTKIYVLKFFGKLNIISPSGIRIRDLQIRSERSHPLPYAVNNIGKENYS